ncbi:hypothetical protein BDK92_6321 [Micromonospora pisi]|uniref:Uncharacterized protein n=1 Tax=Micromonospora pisi TaxID=589240 RepID=A0A495JSD8_9ACTN|nr:hypothetical protein [Micromonospora pisi]RKR91893.1 hypothetical protein BDK92_6321 [Micromonospora pisi]
MNGPTVATTPRPATVTVASILWIILGALTTVGASTMALQAAGSGTLTELIAALAVTALGIYLWVLGVRLRRGRDVRVALTVLGLAYSLVIWPAIFAVPAVVLQYRPSSKQWLGRQGEAPDDDGRGDVVRD